MATPSDKTVRYEQLAKSLSWADIARLWNQVKSGNTPDWDSGKALEYLVARGFELSGLVVQYPFDVPTQGRPLEQIDGFAFLNELGLLLECKDKETADVEVIAKVKHQLERRPPTTIANVFVAGEFTVPAIILANLTSPQRVLLWSGTDLERAIGLQDFKSVLVEKYQNLCRFGLTDHITNYKQLEV